MAHFFIMGRPGSQSTWPDLSTLQALWGQRLFKVSVQVPHRTLVRVEPCAARSPRLGSPDSWAGGPPASWAQGTALRVASFLMLLLTPETRALCPRQHPPSYGPGSTSSRVFSRSPGPSASCTRDP